LEVIAASYDGAVYAWHRDGTPVTGWPISIGNYIIGSLAVADLDGDGKLEVIIGAFDTKVYAWHGENGTPVAGWPIVTGGNIFESPAIADLNGDGKLEVVVGTNDKKVYNFSMPNNSTSDPKPWPMFHHDL